MRNCALAAALNEKTPRERGFCEWAVLGSNQ
jgi:hypothetical protein